MDEAQQKEFNLLEQKWISTMNPNDFRKLERFCYNIKYEREATKTRKEDARLRDLEKKHNIRILREGERIDTSAWEGVR
jgi:hypothetical protein